MMVCIPNSKVPCFDACQRDGGLVRNADAVSNDAQRSLSKGSGACHDLQTTAEMA